MAQKQWHKFALKRSDLSNAVKMSAKSYYDDFALTSKHMADQSACLAVLAAPGGTLDRALERAYNDTYHEFLASPLAQRNSKGLGVVLGRARNLQACLG